MDGMTSMPTSIPYASAVELGRWTLHSYRDLRVLRSGLRAMAEGHHAEGMVVVANELATNALRHARPPAVVRLLGEPGRLILDVADHDPAAEPQPAGDRPPGAGGLGLRLTATFATDLGWYANAVTKHVWASFPS